MNAPSEIAIEKSLFFAVALFLDSIEKETLENLESLSYLKFYKEVVELLILVGFLCCYALQL